MLTGTRSAYSAWMALGHAVSGFDAALTYAKRRPQFGKPLASFPDHPAAAGADARRCHRDAAVLRADRQAGGRRQTGPVSATGAPSGAGPPGGTPSHARPATPTYTPAPVRKGRFHRGSEPVHPTGQLHHAVVILPGSPQRVDDRSFKLI